MLTLPYAGSICYAHPPAPGQLLSAAVRPRYPHRVANEDAIFTIGGEGGIRTLARFYPANPLAGGPLWPLGYLSK